MERLLADAEKLPGALGRDFDISNYSDVVEAIHLVQDNLGITGTTAREAASTIEGSLNTMKGAWANLVTGIASENADLGGLIDEFVDSVLTVSENIIPRIQTILPRIADGINELIPLLTENIPKIAESILPPLLEAASSLVQGLLQGLITAIPVLIPVAGEIIGTLVTNILQMMPDI